MQVRLNAHAAAVVVAAADEWECSLAEAASRIIGGSDDAWRIEDQPLGPTGAALLGVATVTGPRGRRLR
jgi:hypothetical protein